MESAVFCIPIASRTPKDGALTGTGPGLPCFVCGPENRLVEVAISRLLTSSVVPTIAPNSNNTAATDEYRCSYSPPIDAPIVLFGPTGCGKTHLATGITEFWQKKHGPKSAVYCTASDFGRLHTSGSYLSETPNLEPHLDNNTAEEIQPTPYEQFKNRLLNGSLWVIDGLDYLSPRHDVQTKFQTLLDSFCKAGGTVVVTSHNPPIRLKALSTTLRARFSEGLVVPVMLPSSTARKELAQQFAAKHGCLLTETELKEAAGIVDSSPRAILHRLHQQHFSKNLRSAQANVSDAEARQSGSPNSVSKSVSFRTLETIPSLNSITTVVSRALNVTKADLRSKTRRQSVVRARGLAMYLARKLTAESFSSIGQAFGKRDHTTVMHACRKTEELLANDTQLRAYADQLLRLLTCS